MSALLATLSLAAGAAAPPTQNFSMCALYVNQTRSEFSYGLVAPSGRVTDLIDLPGLFGLFDGAAAGAEEGTFYTYCGVSRLCSPPRRSRDRMRALRTQRQPRTHAPAARAPLRCARSAR
jgi:hypothetical protein